MKHRHTLLAAVLMTLAASARGQVHIIVDSQDACPPDTVSGVPAYRWKNGHFVLYGWLCESTDNPRN